MSNLRNVQLEILSGSLCTEVWHSRERSGLEIKRSGSTVWESPALCSVAILVAGSDRTGPGHRGRKRPEGGPLWHSGVCELDTEQESEKWEEDSGCASGWKLRVEAA